MSDIVLIGSPSDHDRIREVVDALHANGLDFWWENSGPQAAISVAALADARCIILFITRGSLNDPGFMALATQAASDRKAIAARLEKVTLPSSLSGITTVDLSRFRGGKNDLFLIDLAAAADAKAKGIDPPAPRGPISRLTKQTLTIGSAAFGLAVLVVGFTSDVFGASSGVMEAISRFDPAQRSAYEAAKDCEALRDFDRTHDGYYAELAKRRYDNPRWVDGTERVEAPVSAYVLRNDMAPAASRADAEAAATLAMEVEADKTCRELARQNGATSISRKFDVDTWSCEPQAGGLTCGLLAKVICTMDQPAKLEDCGLNASPQ